MAQPKVNAHDNDDFFADDDNSFESDSRSFAEQIDLQHYLRVLRKRKWPISLFTAVVTALAGYYAYTATPIYSSTSTLLIESQGGNNLVQFEELVGLDTDSQDYYQTQFELLRSRGLAVRVIDHMDLWSHPDFVPAAAVATSQDNSGGSQLMDGAEDLIDKAADLLSLDRIAGNGEVQSNPDTVDSSAAENEPVEDILLNVESAEMATADELPIDSTFDETLATPLDDASVDEKLGLNRERQRVVNSFMSRLTVTPVRSTQLVKLSFESPDPEFAATVANTFGEQYIESYLDAKLELTTQASNWLNQRLGDLKSVLDDSEDRLIAFKEENGLVDVDGSVGRLNEQELLLATAELAQARSELSSQADVYRQVQNLRSQPELLESISEIQADPLVRGVKIEQGQAQRALDELRNRYGDLHPRVIDATSQLETLNTTLQGHIERVTENIAKNYQLVQQRVANIERKLASGKQEIQAIGTKKFELDELEREVLTNRDIYNTFFSRITEAKSADGLETANARISDRAVPALGPIKPKKQLIIALAALASLMLSMLMAILYEQMDDTIKSTSDIEDKLGVRLLGILPLVKGKAFRRSEGLPLNPLEIRDDKGRFVEAVNTVRTALSLDDRESIRKVIVVTSSAPSEGKSTTSLNLAYALGQLESVLLIDCDMRRPTIGKAAGIDRNAPGLSNLIARTAPASKCITRGAFGGVVDILPSGAISDHPLELLSSKRFEKIIEQLSEHYDRIVIDSAPAQAVSDALVISRFSDAVIYCVKSNETSMQLVKRGIQRLRQSKARIAGIIITQVDINKIASYGGDFYYQGYYDYYGYTALDERGKPGSKMQLTKQELNEIRRDDSVELDLGAGHWSQHDVGENDVLSGRNHFMDELDNTVTYDYDESEFRTRDKSPRNAESPRAKGPRRSESDDFEIL